VSTIVKAIRGSQSVVEELCRPLNAARAAPVWLSGGLAAGLLAIPCAPAAATPPLVPATAGLAILQHGEEQPPGWAIGQFRGHDRRRNADLVLTIHRNGRVRMRTEFHAGRRAVVQSGYYRHRRLYLERGTLALDRDGDSIRTIEVGGERARVRYRRVL